MCAGHSHRRGEQARGRRLQWRTQDQGERQGGARGAEPSPAPPAATGRLVTGHHESPLGSALTGPSEGVGVGRGRDVEVTEGPSETSFDSGLYGGHAQVVGCAGFIHHDDS